MIDSPTDPRFPLHEALAQYAVRPGARLDEARRIQGFMAAHEDCFERSCVTGHITGSAWLLNPVGDKALLLLHSKLQRWLQPGGHADGDTDACAVALKEAREESGIEGIELLRAEIFDVDVHLIPARPQKGEPAHYHYDVRYLLRAPHEDFVCSDESDALAWLTAEELLARRGELDASVLRMVELWQAG